MQLFKFGFWAAPIFLLCCTLFYALNGVVDGKALAQPRLQGPSLESWEELKNLVVENGVTTVDQLLAHLPEEYTMGYTLLYRTRALGQERVSARRPRVLLFGKNAKLVLAYNSHRTGGRAQPGEIESVETLEFNESTGKSYLRELYFDGKQVPDFAKVETNPQRCLACHGQSPDGVTADSARGLWDPYNSWSGAYGSLSRQLIDFIKLGTTEYNGFQEFLNEKQTNPRYSFLKLRTQNMSELPDSAFISTAFDPVRMNDALTFTAGYSSLPNQLLGMYLLDYNFKRIGNLLADQDQQKRAAFQYLVRGITLDENFAKPDVDPLTNPTNLRAKKPDCLAKIAAFLPDSFPKVSFDQFRGIILKKLRADYSVAKAAVEVDNMGLSKLRPGFDPSDPYDENIVGRELMFDSINPSTIAYYVRIPGRPGLTGNSALFYLFYLMDVPSQDLSIGISRGTNIPVDSNYVLSGNANMYVGNSPRCHTPEGKVKSAVIPYDIKQICFTDPVEEFFTFYLPTRFYQDNGRSLDPAIQDLSCDQLAMKSKEALTEYFHR